MQSGNSPAVEPEDSTGSKSSATVTVPVATVAVVEAASRTCLNPVGAGASAVACWRWRCDGDGNKAATWDGNASTCNAGDLDADAATRALKRINVHRDLAGVAPFTQEPTWTAAAQQCALIAHANGKLSHTPPESWSCWSTTGSNTSAGSLIANRSVAQSIAAYVQDPGNEPTMVHRRWLLDETLSSVGFGSTDAFSCIVVDGESIGPASAPKNPSPRGWSAWPPGGDVPFDMFADEALDTAGWTIQSTSEALDDDDVRVTVTSNGAELPITQTHLAKLEGSRSAIRFLPNGWTTTPGRSYTVHVNTAAPIDYTVTPADCDTL